MQYLLLIYESEALDKTRTPDEQASLLEEYLTLTEELKTQGRMLGGEALQSVDTAKTVRIKDNKSVVTDGPFAETKEQLGGFYFIEAESLSEAEQIAAKIPAAKTGSIEIRPVIKYE